MFIPLLRRLRGLLDTSGVAGVGPTHVRRLEHADDRLSGELTLVERLVEGDCILCVAGDAIPCCGTVLDGCASVRDDATGDAAPFVVRDGASVRPGMAVVSNFLIVRIGEEIMSAATRYC